MSLRSYRATYAVKRTISKTIRDARTVHGYNNEKIHVTVKSVKIDWTWESDISNAEIESTLMQVVKNLRYIVKSIEWDSDSNQLNVILLTRKERQASLNQPA